jgi:hypothetical protein
VDHRELSKELRMPWSLFLLQLNPDLRAPHNCARPLVKDLVNALHVATVAFLVSVASCFLLSSFLGFRSECSGLFPELSR